MRNDDLIGSAEACAILGGIDRATLVRRIQRGELVTVTKLPGGSNGTWVFRRADVLRHKAELETAKAS